MVGLNRPFADQFRTTSFMHCSSSTAGTSVRLTRSWAGCPDRVVVSGLSPDGEVFLLTSPFIDRYVGEWERVAIPLGSHSDRRKR
jgi:hypothetical protein